MRKGLVLLVLAAFSLEAGYAQPTTARRPAPAAPPATPQSMSVAAPTAVETAPLAQDAFSTGTLARGQGALEPTLWKKADPGRISYLLDAAPTRLYGPSLGEALRRTLLTPGESPQGAPASLGGKKLLVLARTGFTDEVRTIASLSSAPKSDPHVGQALATADLLDGAAAEACKRNAALSTGRDTPFWVKLRVLCYSMAGAKDAADLSLTLLREQGFLTEADDAILSAVVLGAQGKAPAPPQTALHLASLRFLQAPVAVSLLAQADAGVLKALANDVAVPLEARVAAAARAAAMGVLSHGELKALFDSFDVATVESRARPPSGDPLADAVFYKSVRALSAPELLRDKAAMIADALAAADTFARAYAAAVLYADDLDELEGVLVAPGEASRFALARMALGDGDGAARWLFSMIGAGVSTLSPADAATLADLVNLLAILDQVSAKAVAEAAGVSVDYRAARGSGAEAPLRAESDSLARIVEAAFDAAIDNSAGQAALAALAASTLIGSNDPTGRVIVSQSLRAAGFNELRRRVDFETAWRGRFVLDVPAAAPSPGPGPAGPAPITPSAAAPAPASMTAPAAPASAPGAGLAPRLKPRRVEG